MINYSKKEFKDFVKSLETKVKEWQEQNKVIAHQFFKHVTDYFFTKYPALENFSWTQYTSYFCDGDPCYFGVNSYDVEVNGGDDVVADIKLEVQQLKKEIKTLEANNPMFASEDMPKLQVQLEEKEKFLTSAKALGKAQEELHKALDSLDNDMFLAMFGDHVKVTVTRTDITTETYEDHD